MQLFAIVYFVLYDLLTLSCAHPYTDIQATQARIHSTFTYTCTHKYYIHSTTTSIDRYSHHIHLCTQHMGGVWPTHTFIHVHATCPHICVCIHLYSCNHAALMYIYCLSRHVLILSISSLVLTSPLFHRFFFWYLSFPPFSLPSILPLLPVFPSRLCFLAPHLSLPFYLPLPCHFLAL